VSIFATFCYFLIAREKAVVSLQKKEERERLRKKVIVQKLKKQTKKKGLRVCASSRK